MKLADFLKLDPEELPLDNLVTDGGFCGIFRTIGCVGDSLSSGEFESLDKDGNPGYYDMFEYSWGQYLARSAGCKVYNFSRGGMTAIEYMNSFAQAQGFWTEDKLCQAYIIALGANDLFGLRQKVGDIGDVDLSNYENNADTFCGHYAKIIQRLKQMQPRARFFLVTMPREGGEHDELKAEHAKLLYKLADMFEHTYVIDLFKYAPVYDADFKKRFFMSGHMNPAGYLLSGRMTESYIDYIIRHNYEDFSQIGFIGTDIVNVSCKE